MINRRGLITGLVSFVAAPAIVRASSLMPVKLMQEPVACLVGVALSGPRLTIIGFLRPVFAVSDSYFEVFDGSNWVRV